ncbi:MAG: trypsin-like serine protease, partial [Polyangiaceae bacterium]|nr:trypsin-like serine protease [Polyangiaceae bacterium]
MRFASLFRSSVRARSKPGNVPPDESRESTCQRRVAWWFFVLVLVAIVAVGCGSRDNDEGGVAEQGSQLHRGVNASVPDLQGVVAILDNGGPNCTGTLIAPQIVLSSAHCSGRALIPGCTPKYSGYSNISVRIPNPEWAPPSPDNAQIIGVDGVVVHPLYRGNSTIKCAGSRDHSNCDPDVLATIGPYCNVVQDCFDEGAIAFGQHIEHDLALYHLVSAPVGVTPVPVIVSTAPVLRLPGGDLHPIIESPAGADFRSYPEHQLDLFLRGYREIDVGILGISWKVQVHVGAPHVTIIGFGDGSHEWSADPWVLNRDMGVTTVTGVTFDLTFRDGCKGEVTNGTKPMIRIQRKTADSAFTEKGDSGSPILIGTGDTVPGYETQPTPLPAEDASDFGLGSKRYAIGALHGASSVPQPGGACSRACAVDIVECSTNRDCASGTCRDVGSIAACTNNPACEGIARACDAAGIPCATKDQCPEGRECIDVVPCPTDQTCVGISKGTGVCGWNCKTDSDCPKLENEFVACYAVPAATGAKVCRSTYSVYAPTSTPENGDWIIRAVKDLDGDGVLNDN